MGCYRAVVELSQGTVLDGKYRIERVLGRGGMGVVVEVTNINLDARMALKLLLPEALDNPVAVERFQREARASARIKNPHVAQVLDVDTLPSGEPYIVMEYLEGQDLERWLRDHGPVSTSDAVRWILQACDALGEAHRVGVTHRDIKPANLFLVRRSTGAPLLKVLDFGISKVAQDGGGVTTTKAFVGSPLYMSPEQMRSARAADSRSDIWSLGVVMFELLAGEVPFRGETVPELALKVTLTATPSLCKLRPEVPRQLEAVVTKCLEKEPDRRYQSIDELEQALRPFANSEARSEADALPATRDHAPSSPTLESSLPRRTAQLAQLASDDAVSLLAATGTASSWSQTGPTKKNASRRWPLAVAACVFLTGFGVVGTRYWTGNEEPLRMTPATLPAQTFVDINTAVGSVTNGLAPGPQTAPYVLPITSALETSASVAPRTQAPSRIDPSSAELSRAGALHQMVAAVTAMSMDGTPPSGVIPRGLQKSPTPAPGQRSVTPTSKPTIAPTSVRLADPALAEPSHKVDPEPARKSPLDIKPIQ